MLLAGPWSELTTSHLAAQLLAVRPPPWPSLCKTRAMVGFSCGQGRRRDSRMGTSSNPCASRPPAPADCVTAARKPRSARRERGGSARMLGFWCENARTPHSRGTVTSARELTGGCFKDRGFNSRHRGPAASEKSVCSGAGGHCTPSPPGSTAASRGGDVGWGGPGPKPQTLLLSPRASNFS